MCIVCGPGGSRLVHSIAASFGAPGGRYRPRFMAEEVAPAFAPPLDPADLRDLKGPSDVILRGGPILTMRGADDVAQAIAVRAGRIQSVGEEATVLALRGRLTRIIDLDGRALLPGSSSPTGIRRSAFFATGLRPRRRRRRRWLRPSPIVQTNG